MRVGKGGPFDARSLEFSSRVDLSLVMLQHSACLDLALFEASNLICMLRSSLPLSNALAGLFSDENFAEVGADSQYKLHHFCTDYFRSSSLILMLKCLVSCAMAT